jgi:hypothetical protein
MLEAISSTSRKFQDKTFRAFPLSSRKIWLSYKCGYTTEAFDLQSESIARKNIILVLEAGERCVLRLEFSLQAVSLFAIERFFELTFCALPFRDRCHWLSRLRPSIYSSYMDLSRDSTHHRPSVVPFLEITLGYLSVTLSPTPSDHSLVI